MNTSYQKLNKIKGAIFIAPFFVLPNFCIMFVLKLKVKLKIQKIWDLKEC